MFPIKRRTVADLQYNPNKIFSNTSQDYNSPANITGSRVLSQALDRKTISQAYHTEVPTFLKAEGPFIIYNHSLRNGQSKISAKPLLTSPEYAAQNALKRHEEELLNLKILRENQKRQFYCQIDGQNEFARIVDD